jgi:hypothetical protein
MPKQPVIIRSNRLFYINYGSFNQVYSLSYMLNK